MLDKRKPRYRGYTDFPEGLEMCRGVFFFFFFSELIMSGDIPGI